MAAIANVKVIESMIEVPAVACAQYRKVDRKAKVGDVIKYTDESSSYLTSGEFYEVVRMDSYDDPQIIDNDGDEYDLAGDDYEVFEKVTEGAKPEANPEPDELFTYEGVQYRKVKRKAAVGELCLRTKHFVKNQVGSVTKVGRIGAIEPVGDDGESLFPGYYVVLEPVKPATAAGPESKYKPGDKVRTKHDDEVLTLKERRPSADDFGYGTAWTLTNGFWLGENQFELCEDTVASVSETIVQDGITYRHVKEGEKPTHITRKSDAPRRSWILRDKVYEINSVSVNGHFRITDEDGDNSMVNKSYVIGLVAVEQPKPARIPVGSYVKATQGLAHFRNAGDILEVTEDDGSGIPYRLVHLDGSYAGYADGSDITPISEAEAKAAVEAEAERTKWAAIGRKVGEIKSGDVVEVVSRNGGRNPKGRIGVAKENGTESSTRVGTVENPEGTACWARVKLLVPVEQRFDREAEDAS